MLHATTYDGAFWEKSGRRNGTLRFPEYRTPRRRAGRPRDDDCRHARGGGIEMTSELAVMAQVGDFREEGLLASDREPGSVARQTEGT